MFSAKYLPTLTLILIAIAFQGQTSPPAPKEQVAFLSEDSFPPSAPIPQKVLTILLKEQAVRESIVRASDADKRDPVHLFRAAEVHLFSPNEIDLFIVGNVPIAGADNGWFWVVRSAHKDPKVVLFATGYALELLHSRTNGYRDIRSTWSNPNGTETRIYKFNLEMYKLSKERWNEHQ